MIRASARSRCSRTIASRSWTSACAPESELADKPFSQLPATGSVIGAVIRNGTVLYPRSSDMLRAGDRVIVFVESRRASIVERAL